ncbi:MAG: hypothetical protein Q7S87_16145 [Agitococcus sp.]|nr:hypothetical protein [Agitococcus sp.]
MADIIPFPPARPPVPFFAPLSRRMKRVSAVFAALSLLLVGATVTFIVNVTLDIPTFPMQSVRLLSKQLQVGGYTTFSVALVDAKGIHFVCRGKARGTVTELDSGEVNIHWNSQRDRDDEGNHRGCSRNWPDDFFLKSHVTEEEQHAV